MKRYSVLTGVVSALALVLILASNASSAIHSRTAQPFVIDYALPPANLDPIQDCSLQDDGFRSSMYVTLTQHPLVPGPSGTTQFNASSVVPYLASAWTISKNGLTYTFHLRSGAKFPSGRPVNAAAVKYSWERAKTESPTCGGYYWNAGGSTTIVSMDTPNATTVVVHLKNPSPLLLQSFAEAATGIVDPGLVNAHGGLKGATQWLATHDAGSGPYLLKSYTPGASAEFVANPTFFGPKPLEPDVLVNFITSDPTLLLRAKSGAADVTIGLSKVSVASLKGNSCCKIVADPSAQWTLIAIPNQFPPFNNTLLRKALTYAVPYQALTNSVTHGYGQIYYGPFPPAFPAYRANLERPRPYNLTTAKQLIAESKVKLPISLPLVIRDGDTEGAAIATAVQNLWKGLGINLTIQTESAAAYANAVSATKKTYALVREDGPSVLDPLWLLSYDMTCGSPYNTSNYCNQHADALLKQAFLTPSASARQTIWNKVAKIWVGDSPRIPVFAEEYVAVLKKGVTHYCYSQEGFAIQYWGR